MRRQIVILLALLIGVSVGQVKFGEPDTPVVPAVPAPKVDEKKTDSRLGLVADSIGVDPVPGASYPADDAVRGDYNVAPPSYGGGQGGNYNGQQGGGVGQGGNYNGGGQQGGGVGQGGNYNGGGQQGGGHGQGGNYNEGGQQGGGHGQGGNYNGGGQGGNYGPPPAPCRCIQKQFCTTPGGGEQGGNYNGGGGQGGNYNGGGGQQGGNYGGGSTDPGLTTGQYGQQPGIVNPPTDGAGVIDIRIVNKPPGGVVCQQGEVYCCESQSQPITQQGCGVVKNINVPGYIPVYGQAEFGEYPFLAVILGKSNNYIGAGALLDSYHILTAAHKVSDWKPGFYMKVRLGEWNAKDDSEPYKNVEIDVASIEVHPAFNYQNLQNDVAIIKLAQPINIEAFPHINSVCLPPQGANFVGTRCWVSGFGKDAFGNGKHSYILKEVDVPIIDGNECESRLRGTRLGNYFNLNRKSFLCAGGEEGKDACTGDGGSPLVCNYGGKFHVVGLVAWGIGCADYGVPGVYVNVPNYQKWIESKIFVPQYDERKLNKPATY